MPSLRWVSRKRSMPLSRSASKYFMPFSVCTWSRSQHTKNRYVRPSTSWFLGSVEWIIV
jgi:hypothetical protein